MPPLADDLRTRLEKAVIAAREKAEEGARAALQRLHVDTADSKAIPAGFPQTNRALRIHLRAHARQLGDLVPEKGPQKIDRLVAECAYEFWHRMLFARFLAENDLLIHPDSRVSISLEDCKEFGAEETPPTDGWTFASRCAARMLPQIFRPDDPLLQVPFAPEHKLALESILAELPVNVFTADDSLGWVYQFWQTKRKEQVNKSEVKIGGDELPAVTQLFTEHYMVLFLLHNTLGAWWVSKQQADGRKPADVNLPGYAFDYLRFRDDGTPAAGTFSGWPREARALRVLDPCCGSGHFLVAAFELLVRIRMHDEGLSPRDACEAVVRDNLFGLELDARCTQIAAFNLALAAWKFPQAGGYRTLPPMHIACSGQALKGKREDWLRLAGADKRLRFGMDMLYDLFEKANDLGSLIDPRAVKAAPAMVGSFEELQPLLQEVLQREDIRKDAELAEAGVMAQGIARAAELLAAQYVLIVTNVPYLGRGKQNEVIKSHLEQNYKPGKADLATAFILRGLKLCEPAGCMALVTPQNWLFLPGYRQLRERLLEENSWNIVARLGANAFQDMNFWASTTALVVMSNDWPKPAHDFMILDVSADKSQEKKSEMLRGLAACESQFVAQELQLKNPDARISLDAIEGRSLLNSYAEAPQGIKTGDDPRYRRNFWEVLQDRDRWRPFQGSGEHNAWIAGLDSVIDWSEDGENFARRQGSAGWGKNGIVLKLMGYPQVSFHTGALFDSNVTVIVPHNSDHLPAIWCYCSSEEYARQLKAAEQSAKINNATAVKVPFDLAHWTKLASETWPQGLPNLETNDPTQYLFKGDPTAADAPHNLQVTMARLLGYCWPDQTADKLDAFAAPNGIVCLPAIGADKAAAERLRELLAAAYGTSWSPAKEESLLAAVGFGGKTLYDWLRDGFFADHCNLFHNRPFLWHISDGKKDGFSAVINYHKFTESRLRDLIYHYLAEWIKRQAKAVEKGESGADARHAAALELQKKLKLIHEGEKPYDIFVRWKPLDQQPIGWEPDLNDGVRINIRPFMEADILRKKPNIKWAKDKGRDPKSAPWFHLFKGDRINDHHLSLEEKRKARGQGGQT